MRHRCHFGTCYLDDLELQLKRDRSPYRSTICIKKYFASYDPALTTSRDSRICHSVMLNCSPPKTSRLLSIDEGEIFHVHATRSITIHERLAARASARPPPPADNFRGCSLKPCVSSCSRENRSSFRHPDYSHPVVRALPRARRVSCVRNRAFRYVPTTQPILYQNSPLIFPYSIEASRFGAISIIRNRLPVSTFVHFTFVRRRVQVVLDPCSRRKKHMGSFE